jgi:hypothetical protein
MTWYEQVKGDPLPWLLETDQANPGVRYFTLVELLDRPQDDPDVVAARRAAMTTGPIPTILDAQATAGFWVKPGPGYLPKYTGTVWQIIFLAQLGADGQDGRVRAGCNYVLDHTREPGGAFSMDARPTGRIHCLQGNLAAALIALGWLGDPRLESALDRLARSVTGEGLAPAEDRQAPNRYYRSGNSGPGFACSANGHLPCAWGAVKAMLGLARVPSDRRTRSIENAIEHGLDFLLSHDPAVADYPMGYSTKPSQSWFRFGYPIGYVTDVLQNLEVLTALGVGADPRLRPAVDLVLGQADASGRWALRYTYNGKMWADVERKREPSKWVTLRALRVLKRVGEAIGSHPAG